MRLSEFPTTNAVADTAGPEMVAIISCFAKQVKTRGDEKMIIDILVPGARGLSQEQTSELKVKPNQR